MLTIKAANLVYAGKVIFTDLDLELRQGEWLVLLGRSGVGKTSLLRLLAGLQQAFPQPKTRVSAEISWQGSRRLEHEVAYMAQQDGLLPWATALDNVLLPARLSDNKIDRARAYALLEQVGLAAYSQHKPRALSGGMRQRIALARTLIQDKPLLLMDEPCSALDAITRLEMQKLLFARVRAANKTVVMVTHDPWEALRLADRIMVLAGTPAKVVCNMQLPPTEMIRELDGNLLQRYQQLLTALGV